MARQVAEIIPGVSEGVFNVHVHNYRKFTQFGVDANKTYAGPTRVDIVDDSEVFGQDGTDLEAMGVTVATLPTSTPI